MKSNRYLINEEEIMKDWVWKENNNINLDPQKLTYGSNKKAFWKCPKGHIYIGSIKSKFLGRGCNICAGKQILKGYNDLKTSYPELIEEWDYEKNEIQPEEIAKSSSKKVFWKCKRCNHSWQASVRNRTYNKTGCPKCSFTKQTSFPEQALYFYIYNIFPDAINRYTLKDKFTLDIYIPAIKLAFEYDGIAWHSSQKAINNDKKKDSLCKELGIKLVRIKETENSNSGIKFSNNKILYYRDNKDINLNNLIKVVLKNYLNATLENIDVNKDKNLIYENYYLVEKLNSIMIKNPIILKEWDYKKNYPITPDMVPYSSNNKYFWICSKGHHFEMSVDKRKSGQKCPICSSRKLLKGYNDFETWCIQNNRENLLQEWDFSKNIKNPNEYFRGYKKSDIFWKCLKCKYVWKASILDRSKGKKCPNCFREKRYKKVIKYDINMNELARYSSISDASRDNNIPITSISAVCHKKSKKAGGYIWTFED